MITTEQDCLPPVRKHTHKDELRVGMLSGRIISLCYACSRVEKWHPVPEEYDGLLHLNGHWGVGVRREIKKLEDGN